MSLAGLWGRFERDGEEILSCAIITTAANKTMEPIHDRMPVILGPYDIDAWLAGRAGEDVLKPCPDAWSEPVKVSTFVNSVRNKGEACIKPV